MVKSLQQRCHWTALRILVPEYLADALVIAIKGDLLATPIWVPRGHGCHDRIQFSEGNCGVRSLFSELMLSIRAYDYLHAVL